MPLCFEVQRLEGGNCLLIPRPNIELNGLNAVGPSSLKGLGGEPSADSLLPVRFLHVDLVDLQAGTFSDKDVFRPAEYT